MGDLEGDTAMMIVILSVALLILGIKYYQLHEKYSSLEVASKKQGLSLAESGVSNEDKTAYNFFDSLTGLYNREAYEYKVPKLDTADKLPISILVGDLNGLKLTNDIFGHSVGDQLLIAVAKVFLEVYRPEDLVFRWGGDEFVVVMPNTDFDQALNLRKDLLDAMHKQAVGPIKLHVSIGCTTKIDAAQDFEIVFQRAEEEMYWNKTIGQSGFQKDTLDCIVKELHTRSFAEKDHALRVSELAEQFGKFLDLPEDKLRRLRFSGYFHDVGKVGLNADILHRPYPLKPSEQAEMKRHPLVGFRLLSYFEETADLAAAVLAHHERWDGTGYPKGIAGKEIPFIGRLLAIVETYDRVLYDPFGQTFSPEQALQLIADGAGTKFDPHLTDAFLEMIRQN